MSPPKVCRDLLFTLRDDAFAAGRRSLSQPGGGAAGTAARHQPHGSRRFSSFFFIAMTKQDMSDFSKLDQPEKKRIYTGHYLTGVFAIVVGVVHLVLLLTASKPDCSADCQQEPDNWECSSENCTPWNNLGNQQKESAIHQNNYCLRQFVCTLVSVFLALIWFTLLLACGCFGNNVDTVRELFTVFAIMIASYAITAVASGIHRFKKSSKLGELENARIFYFLSILSAVISIVLGLPPFLIANRLESND